MDHLPLPQDPILPLPRVPLVCSELYDCGSFLEYPIRAGWPRAAPSGNGLPFWRFDLFEPANDRELEVFFQTWIFFGLLHELLSPCNLYNPGEYISHDCDGPLVHTRNLTRNLHDWIVLAQAWDEERQTETANHISRCLSLALDSLMVFDRGDLHQSFHPAIKLSLGAICDAVERAKRVVFASHREWYPVRFTFLASDTQAVDRLLNNGWCPSETKFAMDSFQYVFPALYFIQRLKLPETGVDHLGCDANRCKKITVDLDTYRTRHLDEKCTCAVVGPSINEVARCLEQGTFPVLRVCGSLTEEVSLQAIPFTEDVNYVAISHVWADGLGNPRDMALPRCQILYLKNTIAKIGMNMSSESDHDSFEGQELLLWCDTVCVPVIDAASPTEQQRQLKTLALTRMRDVYLRAKHVLVLDLRLMEYSIGQIGLREALMRLSLSRWMGRLWTFQEGFLAKSLLIQFGDKIVDFVEMFDLAEKWFEFTSKDIGFGPGVPMALEGFRGPIRGTSSIWNTRDMEISLDTLESSIEFRAVSYAADEPLCIAGVLDLNLDKIVRTPDSERMQQIWRMMPRVLGGIPQDIIFNRNPRLSHRGFRWAPSTLVGKANRGQYYVTGYADRQGALTVDGLQVNFPAWRLRPGMKRAVIAEDELALETLNHRRRDQQIRLPHRGWFCLGHLSAFDTNTREPPDSFTESVILIFDAMFSGIDPAELQGQNNTLLVTQTSEESSNRYVRSNRVQDIERYSEKEAHFYELCYMIAADLSQQINAEFETSQGQNTLDGDQLHNLRFNILARTENAAIRETAEAATGKPTDMAITDFADNVLKFLLGWYWEVDAQFDEQTEWIVD